LAGLSPSTIVRLKARWSEEYETWRKRSLEAVEYVYVWADGVHVPIRLEEDDLTLLVMIGVRRDGTKELPALEEGYRESSESWASVLRDLKGRGLVAPVLVIGDGNLGLWKAMRQVWPEAQKQRCWVHKLATVLDKLPKRLQPRAKQALHEVTYAPARAEARAAIERFREEYGAKYPKAVASLDEGGDELLTFFDFPAEYWPHLRTTNPIESAEKRWRKLNAPHLVELVYTGVRFEDGNQTKSTPERHAA
jgi:transposase-like protein